MSGRETADEGPMDGFWETGGPQNGFFDDAFSKFHDVHRPVCCEIWLTRNLTDRARLPGSRSSTETPLRRSPHASDVPLWRIHCEAHSQTNLLYKVATDMRDQVISAFARPGELDCIYVEARDLSTVEWASFINSNSNIVPHRSSSACFKKVPLVERPETLTPGHQILRPGLNDWVVVGGYGLYLGDVGFVASIDEDYALLVVPRIASDDDQAGQAVLENNSNAFRPPPYVSVPVPPLSQDEPLGHHSAAITSDQQILECGLLLIEVPPRLLSLAASMPNALISEFARAHHPYLPADVLAEAPPPSEWIFEPEDRVISLALQSSGTVKRVGAFMEIDMDDGTGMQLLACRKVVKLFTAGDFVEVAAGPFRAQRFFVKEIDGPSVHLVQPSKPSEPLAIHANQLLLLPSELADKQLDVVQSRSSLFKKGVVIIRGRYKGRIGTVEEDDQGDSIRVSLDVYDPAHPWRQILVPRQACELAIENAWFIAEEAQRLQHVVIPRASTPVPPSGSAGSSWDPLAPDPPSFIELEIPHPNLWILDKAFLGVPIRAIIGARDHCVRQINLEGRPIVMREQYKSQKRVYLHEMGFHQPGKRDYGRFLIIRGNHMGQHARLLGWTEGTSGLLWDVALVHVRGDGEEDVAGFPELTIPRKDLILAWESSKSRQVNRAMAQRLKRPVERPQKRAKRRAES